MTLAAEYGANVIRLGTFSKVLAPACAWASSPPRAPSSTSWCKQATDLHTPTLTQMAVYEIVKDGFLEEHLPNVREIYRAQGSCMLDAIQKEFPASVSWTKPEGGMFIWVTLPEHMDSAKLLEKAIAQNGLRAGRAVLQQRRPCQHPAPELRHGAGRQDPHGHRHSRQDPERRVGTPRRLRRLPSGAPLRTGRAGSVRPGSER